MVQGWQEEFLLSSVRTRARGCVYVWMRRADCFARVCARVHAFSCVFVHFQTPLCTPHTSRVEALGDASSASPNCFLLSSLGVRKCFPQHNLYVCTVIFQSSLCFVAVISFLRDCRVETAY